MKQLYDTIGVGYAKSRPADQRIVQGLAAALDLPVGAVILDVGAGTGKYARALADRGFHLLAVEPSDVMRRQGLPHPRVSLIPASAEVLPLAAGAAAGAIIVLALHHFRDRATALREVLRVIGRGPLVIFTFEPRDLSAFWLCEYFPRLGGTEGNSFLELADVAGEVRRLTGRTVHSIPFPLPRDLTDQFGAAGWARPESYLQAEVRNGISSFALMDPSEVASGVARLREDLASGRWDQRHGSLRQQSHWDAGYRFIVAKDLTPGTAAD